MCLNPIIVGYTKTHQPIRASCRKCEECMQVRANEWGLRCHFQINDHKNNSFITLTYDNSPVILKKIDMQKFIKRLRKAIAPIKIKYFSCGEYGDQKLRPHFHIIIFGYDFPDKILWKQSKSGKPMYLSKQLTEIWGQGHATVQDANAQTARYSAKYSTKHKENLPWPQCEYPEFNTMSHNLGVKSIMKKIDTYLQTDQIYIDGFSYKIPQSIINKYINQSYGPGTTYEERLHREQIIDKLKSDRKYHKIVYKPGELQELKKRLNKKTKLHQKLREL